MVKVVTGNQQVRVGGLRPPPVYSRVIGLTLVVPAGGAMGLNYTEPVGNNVWLTHVKIMCLPKAIDITQYVFFCLYAGQGIPRTAGDLASWSRICPSTDQLRQPIGWTLTDGRDQIEWDMMRFYAGDNRRFAIACRRDALGPDDGLWVSFTISEG